MDLTLAQAMIPVAVVAAAGLLVLQRRRPAPAAALPPIEDFPDLDRLVIDGSAPLAVLQAACEALLPVLGVPAAWAGEVPAKDAQPTPSAVAGLWRSGFPPGVDLAERALAERRSCTDPARGLAAVPLTAAGRRVGVLVAAVGRGPQASAALFGLERLAGRFGAAIHLAGDQHRLRLLGAAIETAPNAVLIADRDGCVEWANAAFVRASGWSLDEVRGRPLRLLDRAVTGTAEPWRSLAAGEVWRGEVVERRRDGSFYTVEQTIRPMRDPDGGIGHFVVVHEDITEKRRAEEHIRFLSHYDSLTALPNRTLFRDRLGQAIAEAAAGEGLAVLFLDLEHFTRINDALGHAAGDRLLTIIVERLTAAAADAHTIARVGGDEFALVVAGCDGAGAATLAEAVVAAVTAAVDIEGHEIHVGASVGIALHPQDGEDADILMKNADVAMYRAIHEAPNGYRFFSSALSDEVRARLELERDLRLALGLRQFFLHYQPQLEVSTGRIVALEALLRWQHPEHGVVGPARFIPLAEQTGQILPIGEWVVREACAQIKRWQAEGVPVVPVAVNLSAPQLRQPALAERVGEILREEGIDPQLLELELTESMVMADGEATVGMLHRLDNGGVRIAIDDFGTGYSSLAYLKRFPVQKLKIDRSFVNDLEHDTDDAHIARAIISLGHSLGLKVVSEGVETQAQLDYLRAEGCDAVQGFLFSKPVPPEQAAQLLRDEPFMHEAAGSA